MKTTVAVATLSCGRIDLLSLPRQRPENSYFPTHKTRVYGIYTHTQQQHHHRGEPHPHNLQLREAAAHRRRGEEQLHTGNLSEGIH